MSSADTPARTDAVARSGSLIQPASMESLLDATRGRTVLLSTHRGVRADQIDSVLRFEGDKLVDDRHPDDRLADDRLIGAAVPD